MTAAAVSLAQLVRDRRGRAAAALVLYAGAAVLLFGRGVLGSPETRVVGDGGPDKTIFLWSLRWWPHALARGHDPFAANVVWVPHGVDLAWVTSVPLASLVAAPLTAAVGPVATYDVLALAGPVTSAWAAYALARWLTGAFWPAVLGGWLFGFSAFEIGHLVGHLNLVLLPFVPLAALLVLRALAGELGRVRVAVLLSLVLVAQLLVSTEIFVTLVLVGLVFLAAALLLDTGRRRAYVETALTAAAGIALALVEVSPYLWHAFVSSSPADAPLRSPYSETADVLNYVVPTRRIWLQVPGSAEVANRFTATGAERGAYVGVAALAIVALWAWRHRRAPRARAVMLGLVAVAVWSLGSRVRVAGADVVWTPWRYLARLPVLKTILPVRLTLFVALVVALVVAAWLAEERRASFARWALALVALVLVLPDPATSRWSAAVPNPRFFRAGLDACVLRAGEVALVLPLGGDGWSLYWQAEDGFRYRLVDGHLGREVTRAEARWADVYRALGPGPTPPHDVARLRSFLAAHRVGAILVAHGTPWRVRRLVAGLGLPSSVSGDVLVYRLHGD